MTTIAYRDGVLAGDSRESGIGEDESAIILCDDSEKVIKLKDGRLFGGARTSEDIFRLQTALVKGRKPPKLEDINAILIDKKGRIWLYEGRVWQPVKQTYYAVGSGSVYAFAAMDAGATALEAVAVGIKRDPYSGGPIRHVSLDKSAKVK